MCCLLSLMPFLKAAAVHIIISNAMDGKFVFKGHELFQFVKFAARSLQIFWGIYDNAPFKAMQIGNGQINVDIDLIVKCEGRLLKKKF